MPVIETPGVVIEFLGRGQRPVIIALGIIVIRGVIIGIVGIVRGVVRVVRIIGGIIAPIGGATGQNESRTQG